MCQSDTKAMTGTFVLHGWVRNYTGGVPQCNLLVIFEYTIGAGGVGDDAVEVSLSLE